MAAVHNHPACCQGHHHHPSTSDQLFHLLEKVTAIALGVFCAYASMELFLPFFFAGVAIGLYQHLSSNVLEEAPAGISSCSQGFLEQLTGVRLPPLISLVANVAVIWCHIDHHTAIFVPIVGISLGAWSGQAVGKLGSQCVQAIRA